MISQGQQLTDAGGLVDRAPTAGSAPPSPPGQGPLIDAEVADVAAVEAQFQAQMAARDAAARRTRRGGLARIGDAWDEVVVRMARIGDAGGDAYGGRERG